MNLGENIKKVRKIRGMTQKELGDLIDVSQSAIGQFEKKDNINSKTLEKIAQAMHVSVLDLYYPEHVCAKSIKQATWDDGLLDIADKCFDLLFIEKNINAEIGHDEENFFIIKDHETIAIFTDEQFWEICKEVFDYFKFKVEKHIKFNAVHGGTGIEVTDEMRQHDDEDF